MNRYRPWDPEYYPQRAEEYEEWIMEQNMRVDDDWLLEEDEDEEDPEEIFENEEDV